MSKVWFITGTRRGLVSLAGALCYAELAAAYPDAGGNTDSSPGPSVTESRGRQ